ncbi:MAG: RluA family pseudouridine synthase [Candidatus Binatia bacterium]|jgi:23S rRNA pseudouridine1911/1915/1917 synthase|nr:RluA family pseudouridine synthase [Candidatus Binatia bacterium]
MSIRFAIIEGEHAGVRLDTFLACHLIGAEARVPFEAAQGREERRIQGGKTRQINPTEEWKGLTRSAFKKLIADGKVRVNGEASKPGVRLKRMDRIEIQWSPPQATALLAEPIPLEILHEDGDLIVVNKPPGMVVHPAAGNFNGTLVNALLHRCSDLQGIGGEIRPGIVHRLDKDTSGAIVVAKNEATFRHLASQFKERKVTKMYGALVWGKMAGSKGLINRPIGRHRRGRKWMSSLNSLSRSREAITEWSVKNLFSFKDRCGFPLWITFLHLRLRTGRTHQIRVHLADEGFPVVGDQIYGRKKATFLAKELSVVSSLVDFPRQALHAERLGFIHPRSGSPMDVVAPWPADMRDLLDNIKARRLCGHEGGGLGS